MKNTEIKSRYKNENDNVREYMDKLIDSLTRDYGAIDDAWLISLDMIATWVEIFFMAREKMRTTEKPVDQSRYYHILNSASNQIIATSKMFATNPATKTRLTTAKNNQNQPVNAEDMIASLLED